MKKGIVLGSVLGVTMLFSGFALTQQGGGMKAPAQNISGKRHPNLAAAQRFCDQAFEKISAAQAANEFDLGGHGAKAKELLEQASKELKEAARSANQDHK